MVTRKPTDAELLLLGLVAEMPRHGYELEQIIVQRGMREWTQIGFSSIYFVLGKLEKSGLVTAKLPDGRKSKKTFSITVQGQEILTAQTLDALSHFRPTYSSVLLGMAHWPLLDHDAAIAALQSRSEAVHADMDRLENVRFERQPTPDFIEALFDFSAGQLRAEADWIERTLEYMNTKPRGE